MQISKERLEKLKDLYEKHFGKKLSDAEALVHGTKLLSLVKIVYEEYARSERKLDGK